MDGIESILTSNNARYQNGGRADESQLQNYVNFVSNDQILPNHLANSCVNN
jgi:hypothetical protein